MWTRISRISMVAVCLLVGVFAAAGCGGSDGGIPVPGRSVALNTNFTLRIGEVVNVQDENLVLTLRSIPEDARCPIDATCPTGGNATTRLALYSAGQSAADVNLNTDPSRGPGERDYRAFRVKLVDLTPYPRSNQPTPPGDYVGTFIVTKP